jgi:hypothetical protein
MEMTGWICTQRASREALARRPAMLAVRGKNKSGDAVFVDGNGKVTKISNPAMVKRRMGQKVKAMQDEQG